MGKSRSPNTTNTWDSRSPEDTIAWGVALAGVLKRGDFVGLDGPLGAGKSVLARGIAQGLGVTGPMPSPTYTLLSILEAHGSLQVYHFDLYRIKSPEQLEIDDVEPFFECDGICLVEWSERAGDLIPAGAWRVALEIVDTKTRRISVTGPRSLEFTHLDQS